jgi:hypothetical protein
MKKNKQNCHRFEFKPRHVNDSSQSNQETDHLVSQSPPWWVHWQQKHKVLNSSLRPHEAQLEDPKSQRKAQEGHLEDRKPPKSTKGTKSGKAKQNGKEELKKLKSARKDQNQSSKSTLPLKFTPPNTLNASSPLR